MFQTLREKLEHGLLVPVVERRCRFALAGPAVRGQRLLEQAGQAGKAVGCGFHGLRALADLIEEGAQIVGAVVQRLRLEIARRVVEGGVDLLPVARCS